jgi:hypothetical protein
MQRRGTPVAASSRDVRMDKNSDRGAIGGSSQLGTDDSNYHYDTPAVQIGNTIRDGDEFVLLVRSNQSDGFQVWSSTDKHATPQLIQQATRQVETT